MRVSTQDIAHQPMYNEVQDYPLSNPDAELFRDITALAQCLENPCTSSNCFCRTGYHPPFPGSSDTRTSGIGIPGNSGIQNITTLWPTSIMNQFSSHESFAQNELSRWGDVYKDSLVTEHYPTLIAPSMPQIERPEIEVGPNKTHPVDHSLQRFSVLHYQPRVSLHGSLTLPERLNTSPRSTSESPLEAVSRSPSQECYHMWKKVPVDAIIVTGSNKFVPQALYRPLTEADRERYLEQVLLSPPIIFMTKEPLEWGIPLEDARDGKMQRLVDRGNPVLQGCGPSVSIRIKWPGYPSFKRQISSRNWRKMKGPITKEKLAESLAKTTGQFIENMSHKSLEADAERIWRVGSQHIKVEDLILVSLHHVSKGSWQPHFRLRHDYKPCL